MNTTSIRIIGGRNKSYRIVFKASPSLRPTSDRAKETLFSWLQFEIQDKACLDLFSGTGGLGFEALSRGASHVTFVEKDKSLFKNILKNVAHLEYQDKSEVACSAALKWMQTNKRKFDVIFLDPPYKEKKLFEILENIFQSNLLKNKGVIIIHRHKKEIDEFPEKFKIIEEKSYGISKVIFGNYI